MSKVPVMRQFGRKKDVCYPNFGYVDEVDKANEEFPLTYYYNCFRNEMKAFMSENLTQDDLKDIRRITRMFCDTQAHLFNTPDYYFTRIVAGLMLAIDSDDADTHRAKLIDILCREYHKLRKNKLIKKHLRNPLWKLIYYLTNYDDNKLVLFNILGIMYFYSV